MVKKEVSCLWHPADLLHDLFPPPRSPHHTIPGVSAIDNDAGDTLTYTIALGNDEGRFAISSSGNVGTITVVAGHLDFEGPKKS